MLNRGWTLGLATLLGVAVAVFTPDRGMAAEPEFDRLVDDSTLIPGSTNPFIELSFPSLADGEVIFRGSGLEQGYYRVDAETGDVNVVVDEATPIPGGGGALFNAFTTADIENGEVVFVGGDGLFAGRNGVYRTASTGGPIQVVADTETIAPGLDQNFRSIYEAALGGGEVVFRGTVDTGATSGVFRERAGTLHSVADTSTLIPGSASSFTGFTGVEIDETGNVVFQASGPGLIRGIYSDRSSTLETVIDNSTLEPGSGTPFSFIGFHPTIDDATIVFESGFSEGSNHGVFLDDGNTLRTVADRSTVVPGGSDTLRFFRFQVAHEGDTTVFRATTSGGNEGIFAEHSGEIIELLMFGTELDGALVDFANFYHGGLDGDDLALVVDFLDGSEAIYLVTIPEPGTAVLLGLGLVGLAAQRGRREVARRR